MARKVVRYATKERLNNVPEENKKVTEKYLKMYLFNNPDTKESTVKVYRSNLNIFMSWLANDFDYKSYGFESPDEVTLLDETVLEDSVMIMSEFKFFCREVLGNNKKAINAKVSAVSAFYYWAVKNNMIDSHPFADKLDRYNTSGEKIIAEHFLSVEEVDQIKAELDKTFDENYEGKYDVIDAMIFNISYDSACRVGALGRLTVSSLVMNEDGSGGYFESIREKRGKIVDIPFGEHTAKLINKFLDWREEKGVDTDGFIPAFYQDEWIPMSTNSITIRVRDIGKIIGIDDFRPHSIRKTRLNLIAEKDIKLAKTLANHESLDTTEKFYTKHDDAKGAFEKIQDLL